jgi:hypothetical protein
MKNEAESENLRLSSRADLQRKQTARSRFTYEKTETPGQNDCYFYKGFPT